MVLVYGGLLAGLYLEDFSDKPHGREGQGRNPQRGENPEPRPGDDRAEFKGDE